MRSAIYTPSLPFKKTCAGASAAPETEMNAPRGSESRDNNQPHKTHFRGGGILLRPIPFYVRNHEPTLQEFEIF